MAETKAAGILAIPIHDFGSFSCPRCRFPLKVREGGAVMPTTDCCNCNTRFGLVCPEDPEQTKKKIDREEMCVMEEVSLRQAYLKSHPEVFFWDWNLWRNWRNERFR